MEERVRKKTQSQRGYTTGPFDFLKPKTWLLKLAP